MDPNDYWKSTMKELWYKEKNYDENLRLIKLISHDIYNSQYDGFSGKKIFPDSWIKKNFGYLFDSKQEKQLSPEQANDFLAKGGWVKQ